MRNQNLLVTFVAAALVLLLAPQALAQVPPIQGWDKARFGMTMEEVKAAYGEEENIEGLDKKTGEDYLQFSIFRPLRDLPCFITFFFVDDRLFKINLFIRVKMDNLYLKVREQLHGVEREQSVMKDHKLWLLLIEIEGILERKYGFPLKEERTGDRRVVVWKDAEGNGLSLMVNFEHDDSADDYFNIIYFHKELTEIGEQKVRTQEGMSTKIEAESF